MRDEMEIVNRAELLRLVLAEAAEAYRQGKNSPEQDLRLLSLLDQLETLLWVLESQPPPESPLLH